MGGGEGEGQWRVGGKDGDGRGIRGGNKYRKGAGGREGEIKREIREGTKFLS